MGEKVNVYNLGSKGVNVVKSPIQLVEGELRKAQNAFVDLSSGDGALRKRNGLSALNAVAAAGSVQGLFGIPLAQTQARTFYIGIDQDATAAFQWVTSINAFASTATATTPSAPYSNNGYSNLLQQFSSRVLSTRKALIFASATGTDDRPVIKSYDGVVERQICIVPRNANDSYAGVDRKDYVYDFILDGERAFFIAHDSGETAALRSRVFKLDLNTAALTQMGESFGASAGELGAGGVLALSLCMHNGQLFVGTGEGGYNGGATGKVYRIRPDVDTAWTLDATFAARESPYSMASYKGRLFAGLSIFTNNPGRLMVRDFAGAWTVSNTTNGAATGGESGWTGLTVFGDNLYAGRFASDGPASETSISKYDNSAWSNVKTIDTGIVGAKRVIVGLVHNSRLYYLIGLAGAGQVSHSSNGTAWTDITTNLTTGLMSAFGVLVT